jgi:hypothetical protein
MATKKKVAPKKKLLSKKRPAKKAAVRKPSPKKAVAQKPLLRLARKSVAPKLQPIAIDPSDQHGPMHIPSHKPAPAYARLIQRSWAGKPPQHSIPIPKR